ncbi:MAG: DUF2934 domain-containing protein [Candidatus Omnitrophica bacterium]|nr:DUF2934 domain-containing protein [Candidatus Omnitrophota bacterium]
MARFLGRRTTAAVAPLRREKSPPQPDPAEVATLAYELYVQRGCVDGHDQEDWLRAEQIVRAQARRSSW